MIRTLGAALNPAAPISARNATAATIQAGCRRRCADVIVGTRSAMDVLQVGAGEPNEPVRIGGPPPAHVLRHQ